MNFKNILMGVFLVGFSHTQAVLASNVQTSKLIDLPTAFSDGKGARNINSKALQRTIQQEGTRSDAIDRVFGTHNGLSVIQIVSDFLFDLQIAAASKGNASSYAKFKTKNGRSVASVGSVVNCDPLLSAMLEKVVIKEQAQLIAENIITNYRTLLDNKAANPAEFLAQIEKELDKAVASQDLTPLQAGMVLTAMQRSDQDNMILQAILDTKKLSPKEKTKLLNDLFTCPLKSAA